MYILPLLELKDGESVHVLEGPGQGEQRPLVDPVEVANRLAGLGAQGFHVVDVDQATDPARNNDRPLLNILEHTVLPVEAGGGVRSLKRIQELLDTGAERVLVGSMGVLHPQWLKEAALIFKERLVACIDVRGDDLLVKGRSEVAATRVDQYLAGVDAVGLATLHVTWLGRDDGVAFMEGIARRVRTPVTYQGTVSGPAELERLERAGVKGVVLGPEIYDGRLRFFDLAKQYRVR